MAGVSRELTLIDRFSSVWDKFIHKAEKAEKAIGKVEAAEQAMARAADVTDQATGALYNWTTAVGYMNKGALLATESFQELVDKGYLVQVGMTEVAQAAEEIPEKIEAASVASEVWQDYMSGLEHTLPGLTGQLENMYLTALKFATEFGEDSDYAKEAQERLNAALQASGLTLEDLKARMEETGKAQEKLADDGEKASKRMEKSYSKLGGTLTKLGVMLFGLRKIVQAVKNAMERVPDEIMKPYNNLKKLFSDDLARVTTSLFKGLQKGLDRLNESFNSPAGRKFITALQVGFEALGAVVGAFAGIVADFMDMIFTNLEKTEINFQSAGEFIGKVIGGVYTVVYNIVATIHNLVASFAEFLGNVFVDPLGAVVRLVTDVVNIIVDVVAWAARQIDKLLGSNISGTITSFQEEMNAWVEEKVGPKKFELERMEYIDFDDTMARFAAAGAEYGGRIEKAFRGGEALNAIKASSAETAGNTKAIKDAVTDEDLKMLIDVATQKFVSNVNLTSQTPIITINGVNTGNTEADRKRLVNDLKYMLIEQLASGSTSGQYAYAGA